MMIVYTIRRIMYLVPVLLGVVFLISVSLEFIPGDPAALILGQFATPEAVSAMREDLHLNQPFFVRYLYYIRGLLRADLGRSFTLRREVSAEIAEALPATLELTGVSMMIVLLVSIPLGTVTAAKPNSTLDNVVRVLSLGGLSMPVFWTGILLMLLFGLHLRWFPVCGYGGIRYLVLPAVTLAAPSVGMMTRIVRSSIMEVLHEDYINTARAKGLTESLVLYKHALRNGLIPVITLLGTQLGQMLGGAVLTESVFAWPGLGRLTIYAIFSRDFILIQGVVLVFALLYAITNLLVDISYTIVNPAIVYD